MVNYPLSFPVVTGGGGSSGDESYKQVHKLADYFYEIDIPWHDDDYARQYFLDSQDVVNPGACSMFIKDGKLYRYLDWMYNNNVEFLIRTPAKYDKKAVTGIETVLDITKEMVENKTPSKLYKILPYYIVDGKNDAGLIVGTNVVPVDKGETVGTTPTGDWLDTICASMLVRYVLDRFATVDEAVNYLTEHVSIYVSDKLRALGYEQHFMLHDATKTVCLEFIENEIKTVDITSNPVMTNFHLYGTTITDLVYTSADVADGNLPSSQGIEPHGSGLERYNAIKMANGDPNILYTNTYKRTTDPFWYSEYVAGDLTVDSLPEEFDDAVNVAIIQYESRTRDDEYKTWQTVHKSVYDLNSNKMDVLSQETDAINDIELFTLLPPVQQLAKYVVEIGADGQTEPSDDLNVGGLFLERM